MCREDNVISKMKKILDNSPKNLVVKMADLGFDVNKVVKHFAMNENGTIQYIGEKII